MAAGIIPLSQFSADSLTISSKPRRLPQGSALAVSYAGGAEVVIELPPARVPFGLTKSGAASGKLELKLELPSLKEFDVARRVVASIDARVAEHLRTNAAAICSALGLRGKALDDKIQDLKSGTRVYPLLRRASSEQYPDTLTLKWAEKAAPSIVDKRNRPVAWKEITRGSYVTAVIKVKGLYLNTSLASMQAEPVVLLVTPKAAFSSTASVFADELLDAAAAKKRRLLSDGD